MPIGQHRESYILASGAEGLLIIDQHAAHERTLYERIRDRIASGRVLSQRLLLRVLFEATPEEVETLAARFDDLVGGRLRDRAHVRTLLRDRRAAGGGHRPRPRRDPANGARGAGGHGHAPTRPLRRDRLAASVACRSAVTIRYHLAPEEIRRLIADWAKTRDRFTCPHGRPVVLSMTEEELEKYFKRK